jgi:hypothetical protein
MRKETKYKFRITFVNSTWKDEDIDLIPTIKFRTSDKNINIDSNLDVVKLKTIAFCFLKFAVCFHFIKHDIYEYN